MDAGETTWIGESYGVYALCQSRAELLGKYLWGLCRARQGVGCGDVKAQLKGRAILVRKDAPHRSAHHAKVGGEPKVQQPG